VYGIRGRRKRHDTSLTQGTCLAQGKAFGGSKCTFRCSTRNWNTGIQLIARHGVKGLNKEVGLARHESSLLRTVRSFAPNSHRFVGMRTSGSIVPKRSGAAGTQGRG
jgi:hypothetical protein